MVTLKVVAVVGLFLPGELNSPCEDPKALMAGEKGWDEAGAAGFGERRLKNTLPLYGNRESMNLNSMVLTNILGSAYFKEELIAYKTFHEVVDEIYYKVKLSCFAIIKITDY